MTGTNGVPETPDWSIPHAPRPSPLEPERMRPELEQQIPENIELGAN